MLALIDNIRDFREFLAAKRRKREPIHWNARGATEAVYRPSDARGFDNFRQALRGVSDWGQASERVDALADALRRRHGCPLPLPRKVVQNSDRSLTFFWEGLTLRAFPDRIASLIGGTSGRQVAGVAIEILDMLAFQARIQGP